MTEPASPRRRNWWPLWVTAVILATAGLALLVARPRVDPPAAVPYGGKRGASLAKSAGLKVLWQRGLELQVLKPGTALRSGDVIRFVVRADRPRYLEIRARDAAGKERIVYPGGGPGTPSALVKPDQALEGVMILDAAPGKETVMSLFGDSPFPIGQPPAPELEVALIDLNKAP